jgi:hypothetical protein
MSDNNYVPPEDIYPWTHPDELEVELFDGAKYKIHTFDTFETLGKYFDDYKFPVSDDEGHNPEPGWDFVVRINETYEGVAGRLLYFYWFDTGIANDGKDRNLSDVLEIPVTAGWSDDNGDGTPDALDTGIRFPTLDFEQDPLPVPASTIALQGVIREAPEPPTSEQPPEVQNTDLEAAAEESSKPAAEESDTKAAETEAALDPNDTNTPVGEKVNDANTQLAANPNVESDIRNGAPPGADAETIAAFEAKADQYAAAKTELAGGNLTLARTQELTKELDDIQKSLPPSLSSTATTISNAVGPVQNPGNIPGLESIVAGATKVAGNIIPSTAGALGDIANAVDFVAGTSLRSLTDLSKTIGSSLKQTTSLLTSGNLLDKIPNINNLFEFDPKALIKNINLGQVVNSIGTVPLNTLAKEAEGAITDIVDQSLALFGPVARKFPEIPALQELSGSDAGFGYSGSRSTPSGAAVRQTAIVTPEAEEGGPPPEAPDTYGKLIKVLEKTLTQDWTVKSGDNDGLKPSEKANIPPEDINDPRGRNQIPKPPPNSNPLIMEAYRISGKPDLTKDGTEGEYAWHTAFVNWVLSKAGLPIVVSTSAQAYYTYGERVNHTNIKNLRARRGDIVIFNSKTGAKHIGFFWKYNKGAKSVTILGGNQSGTVKLSNFPFSLKDGDFYVTHIRRNWEAPAQPIEDTTSESLDPRGDQIGDPTFEPKESAIGPTGTPSSRLDSKGATPERDPNLARATFNDDGTVTLPPDATPAETAAVKTKLNNDRIQRDQDAFFNNDDGLSDEEYDAIEIPKRLTPEERKAKDEADRARRKAAAEEKRRKQAEEDEAFYGGGAFSTKNGNSQRIVNTTVTESGGGVTETKGGSTSSAVARESAINAAKGSFYRKLSDAQDKASSIKSRYGVTLTPYQPNGSRKWRLR